MKKLLTVLCALLCVLSLAACAKKEENVPAGGDTSSEVNNIGDCFRMETLGYEIDDNNIKVITDEYVYEGTMTPELYDKLNEIDFFDEKMNEKYAEVLSVVAIDKKTLRSESKLSADEIASLIGKKGQELIDKGFENYGYYMNKDENSQFMMGKNGYNYNVTVEEKYENDDSIDGTELFSKSTIKEITESN